MIQLRQFHRTIRCQASHYTEGMRRLLQHIDVAFEAPLDILKDDPTSTVILVEIDNQLRVIKRTNIRHWTQIFRRSMGRSRAQKSWENAQTLQQCGISTLEPIAYVEKRWGFLKGPSFFISNYIPGNDASTFFLQEENSPDWQTAAQNIVTLIHRLEAQQISHRDLNLSNIILVNQQPSLVDLDSMRVHWFRWIARWAARREWRRFLQNWEDIVEEMPKSADFFREFKKKTMPRSRESAKIVA